MYRCDNCGIQSGKAYSDGAGWICEQCWENLTADFSGDNSVDKSTEEFIME